MPWSDSSLKRVVRILVEDANGVTNPEDVKPWEMEKADKMDEGW